MEKASGNSWRNASKVDVGTDLKVQEVAQNALGQDEANTQEFNWEKIGSNKISIRNDLAKDKMIFSEESSRAFFEMGNVELFNVHHVCTTYLRVRLCADVENYENPSKMRWRIREAFEALKSIY